MMAEYLRQSLSGRPAEAPSARSDQTQKGIAVDVRSGGHAYPSPPAKSHVPVGSGLTNTIRSSSRGVHVDNPQPSVRTHHAGFALDHKTDRVLVSRVDQFWSSRWGQMGLSFPAARRHDRRSQ